MVRSSFFKNLPETPAKQKAPSCNSDWGFSYLYLFSTKLLSQKLCRRRMGASRARLGWRDRESERSSKECG